MSAVRRRLATIMFTDMVGYSALAQRDEMRALQLLDEHRQLLRSLFPVHHGREIDAVGDGFFVEFGSAVDAAHCAVAIQQALTERNAKEASDRQIHVRIGLHLGDVVVEGERVVGDGVNIAARIQPLAAPGEILVSEDVARQIQNKVPFPLDRLGARELKNIDLPMQIYRLRLPWQRAMRRHAPAMRLAVLIGAVSLLASVALVFLVQRPASTTAESAETVRLAVLPFANLSADREDRYFADGMTEELISRLSRLRGIDVIARTSVMQYVDRTKSISDIGRELDVTRILDGSVRRAGDKLRITAQLIDVQTQGNVWSEDYDRETPDVFAIQSDVARQVVDALQVRLLPGDQQKLEKKGTRDVRAYELYLQGRYHLGKATPEGLRTSEVLFAGAIQRDPAFARAHAGLANSLELQGVWGLQSKEVYSRAKQAARRALDLDDAVVEAYITLGAVSVYLDLDWSAAEDAFHKALRLNPGSALAHDYYAINFLAPKGRSAEAIAGMKRALELDPLSTLYQTDTGWIYWCAGDYASALDHFDRAIKREPTLSFAYDGLGFTYAALGRTDEAVASMSRQVELAGEVGYPLAGLAWAYAEAGRRAEAERILNDMTAKSDQFPPLALALVHAALGNSDRAFEWLEKAFAARDFQRLMYVNCGNWFDQLRGDARYIPFARKVGLIE